MVNLFNYNEDLISLFIEEFKAAENLTSEMSFACIYRSGTFPDSRQVFGVSSEAGQSFALKIDTDVGSDRLQKEFGVLKQLVPFFQDKRQTVIVRPIYLSHDGQFHVTEFVDHMTAKQIIYSPVSQTQAAQAAPTDLTSPFNTRFNHFINACGFCSTSLGIWAIFSLFALFHHRLFDTHQGLGYALTVTNMEFLS
jgi:hypothetical protein